MSSVLIKYSSPIEKRLEFYNDFWGERACIGSGSFQWTLSGSIHCAETWQEWCFFSNNEEFIRFLTWVWRGYWYEMSGTLRGTVQKMRAITKCVRKFIIVGQMGIGMHHFLHIFCLPSADTTHQGRPFLFTTFLQCVWPSVSQRSFNILLTMYCSSTRVGFITLPVTYRGTRYRIFRRTTLLGFSSIQIWVSKTLPGFFLSYHHHFSSWRHALLVETDGVGWNTTGGPNSSIRILSRWKKSFGVRTYICSVR